MAADSRQPAPVIHLIGDETMAGPHVDDAFCGHGWGDCLPGQFQAGVRIHNHARGGRSSRSFLWEGLWDAARTRFRPGHWLVIQFGRHDQRIDRPLLGTEPASTFRQFLTRFVREADQRGVFPLFATPVCRRRFTADAGLEDTLGGYPDSMRWLAEELEVPLIDLSEQTSRLLETLGPEPAKALFWTHPPGPAGEHCPDGVDDTLLSELGAHTVATLFARSLRDHPLPLGRWLPSARRHGHGRALSGSVMPAA